ncbi:uncharacterized protein EDB91DRAFT_1041739, partial [Suillus paluster]|uniref:uncharacterized protein n=1 Tax=Suillus paluster TaxID=48578 RepID=UPI001B87F238
VQQCRAHIDKDLAALAESMRVLRSRRNGLAGISCLPPEILANVFKHFAEKKSDKSTSHAPTCLIVTHLCRHWRQVALECPALWSSISISSVSLPWIPVMLERSKNVALVITYNTLVTLRHHLEQVLSQLPRIKVLHLCSYTSEFDRVIDLLSLQPAPLL